MAHLFRVILPVSDIESAARFYAAILGNTGFRVSPGRHYFDCEGTILACYDPTADGDNYTATPNPEPLYFAVSDIDVAYDACQWAGARFSTESGPDTGPLGEVATRPWGEVSFYVHDPFGNQISFVAKASAFTKKTW